MAPGSFPAEGRRCHHSLLSRDPRIVAVRVVFQRGAEVIPQGLNLTCATILSAAPLDRQPRVGSYCFCLSLPGRFVPFRNMPVQAATGLSLERTGRTKPTVNGTVDGSCQVTRK